MYILERAPSADRRLRMIHTHDEIVRPTVENGVMVARVESANACRALQQGRWKFRLVRQEKSPDPDPLTVPPGVATEERVTTCDLRFEPARVLPQPLSSSDQASIDAYADWKLSVVWPAKMDAAGALAFLREPLGPADYTEVVEPVAIVVPVTWWNDADVNGVTAILDMAAALPKGSHVVLVANDERRHGAIRKWIPPGGLRRFLRRVYPSNGGFSAANNLGIKNVRKSARWLLFTQTDASFTAQDVKRALSIAKAHDAVVGPSGGYVTDVGHGQLKERGRNSGQQEGVHAADFVSGYWLLVSRSNTEKVEGWDDGFFLYYEEVDLCMRLALSGVRSVVDSSMSVKHMRSQTIRKIWSNPDRESIRAASRVRFVERWRK